MAGLRRRVLILVTLAETGGAQTYVATLVGALAREYDVTVAAYGDGPLVAAAREAGATYVPLRHVRRAIGPRDLVGLLELVALIRRVRPVVVHVNSSKAGVLGRLAAAIARVPVVVFTVHGWAFKATVGVQSWVYLWADRLMNRFTTVTICVSRTELAAGIRARTCSQARTVVIRNGVDATAVPLARLDGDPPVVISVGRLKQPKAFVTLARALARLERGTFRAVVVGDGPDRTLVEEAAAGAVEFLGDRRDVPELLAQADVFVLSSTSEGLPMSVLEAMAAGLPIVASCVGGLPELVADAGILVPPEDVDALTAALESLLASPERRAALGAAARRRVVDQFSLDEALRRHLELYARLIERAP
ncbi:MAG TPA: glycosyltransferase [Gaiellaceae bacterium]